MDTAAVSATNEGLNLIRRFDNARRRHEDAKRDANSASCEVSNAESELVRWLVPKDAKIGETFCVPVQEAFLEVYIDKSVAYSVGGLDGSAGEKTEHITPKPVVRWRNGIQPKRGV